MLLFEPMPQKDARELYERIAKEKATNTKADAGFLKILLDDLWFFTDGLTRDYGHPQK